MIDLGATQSLEFVLQEAITSVALAFVANYGEVLISDFSLNSIASSDGQSNNTTAVTLISAPSSGFLRQVKYVSVQNTDSAAHTVVIRFNDNGTIRIIGSWFIKISDTLIYVDGRGWYVLDASGKIRVLPVSVTTSSGGSTVTFDGNPAHFLRGDNAFTQVSLTTAVTGVLPVANGGLNIATYTQGDIIYASAADTPSKLAIGTNGKFLLSNGTIPGWSLIPAISSTYFTSLDASNLTSIPAGQLTGSIADARLSSNVPLKNVGNTFASTQVFGSIDVFSASGFRSNLSFTTSVVSFDTSTSLSAFSWVSRTIGTVYQAGSDGFVVALATTNGNTSSCQMDGYTDASNPPVTQKAGVQTFWSGTDRTTSLCMPVKRNDFYKVVSTMLSGSGGTFVMYFVPFGAT